MNKKEKLKTYSDGRFSLQYPSYMKFKCYKKGGSYHLKIDRDLFISVDLCPSDNKDDFLQMLADCRTYDNGMTKVSYLGEKSFGKNTTNVNVSITRKLDGSFIEKRYRLVVTTIKTCCLIIEISGFREFDIMDYADILGSIRVEGEK